FPMSEYSRAPGRGHRELAGERAMRVDRQPSPWPCAAMLAGLLLLCLMAPHYWQNTATVEYAAIGAPAEVAYGFSETGPNWNADARVLPTDNFSSIEVGNVGAVHWA